MKQLIVNADNLGLCGGVNDGIFEAHRVGIVTRASIMAVGEDFEDAARRARGRGLPVGLHLTLVEGRSVATGKPLPRSYAAFARRLLSGRISVTEIEREMRAQIARCIDAGLQLAHLDSHHHVHALPSVMRIVVRLAKEYQIPRVRVPLDSPWRPGAGPSNRFLGKTALCWLASHNMRMVREAGLSACDRMVGLFESGALTEERLLNMLDELPDGVSELLCHPGRVDQACRERYGHWNFQWEDELRALTSPLVRERLLANGIQLV
jgi:chitin disaccharide deacetylase